MSGPQDLRPGDIGFGPLSGAAAAAMWGQFILGEGFTVGRLKVGHVFVVTEESKYHQGVTLHDPRQNRYMPIEDAPPPGFASYAAAESAGYAVYRTGVITAPRVVEAMPRGARQADLKIDRWTPRFAYVRLPEDYPGQADDAAAIARAMIGTPYSFASYAALAAWRFGIATPRLEKWIGRRRRPFRIWSRGEQLDIALPCEAICSVLADQAWSLAGKKIFDDDRPHQCVTPGALAGRLLSYPGAQWLWPGRDE